MKKEVCISGKILFPLRKGNSAIISVNGDCTRTSPVVRIVEEKSDYAHFETLNTVYKVSMRPTSGVARVLPFLMMCA